MVEVWAAVAGASITVAGLGASGISRQNRQGQDSLIRLTAAVDNLSGRLDILHNDIKTKDMEVFARLNELERSVARLEGHTERHQRNSVIQGSLMLLILKPILMTAWKSRAFKELIVSMLEKIVSRTDNDLDDLAVKHVREMLLPDTRVEKQVVSGIIQVTLLVLVMGLALLPFFEFFRGTPHQLAAIKELEQSVPEELLDEDADWFQAWKESGYDQQVYMPYFKQLDNKTGTGYRECFSSAAAMVAAYYKKVRTDDEYNKIRAKYGDTTSIEAQLAALRSLGLEAEFRKDGDADMVELEIEAGRPVLVGWLHHGNMLRGEPPMCSGMGCGHWSVISGYAGKNSNDPEWIMQDPRGYPEMEKGGHSNPHLGRNVRVRQAAFHQRWQVEGPQTGWVILVNE